MSYLITRSVQYAPKMTMPPPVWNKFDLDDFTNRIPLDKYSITTLADEWLTLQEREEKERTNVQVAQNCSQGHPHIPCSAEMSVGIPSIHTPISSST